MKIMRCSINCSVFATLILFLTLSTNCFPNPESRITIGVEIADNEVAAFAATELSAYLTKLYPAHTFPVVQGRRSGRSIILTLKPDGEDLPESPEGYLIQTSGNKTTIRARSAVGLVYGVYGLLEQLGVGFYLSEEILPPPRDAFSLDGWELRNEPLVKERYVFNWHNFLSGCTSWNANEWVEWVDRSQKMGYNSIMVHAYFNNPMHTYSFKGMQKEIGYYTTSAIGREWGNIPLNDVRRLSGGKIFEAPVYGSSAAMVPKEEYVESIQGMMKNVFSHARNRGMGVCFAIDADKAIEYQQETLVKAVPAEATFKAGKNKLSIPNPEMADGLAFYAAQIEGLLASYPMLTEIACWRRGSCYWGSIKVEELPINWKGEFNEFIEHEAAKGARANVLMSCFITSKIVRAFEVSLKKLGRTDIKIVTGTWNNSWAVPTAVLLPDTKLMPIDYGVKKNESLMQDKVMLAKIKKYADGQVIPFLWTHHDDGQYIGRCYKPIDQLNSKIQQAGMAGYGSFHWLNRPQDLFFKNSQRQVWAESVDEDCGKTCAIMAEDFWGDATLGSYLLDWITDAPIFGRATLPNMHKREDKECRFSDEERALVDERLAFLGSVSTEGMTQEQRGRLEYFKALEQFIAKFIDTHRCLDRAEKHLKNGQLAEAQEELLKGNPEQAVELFSRLSVTGMKSRGEMAYVISLATKWIGDYDSFRQRARLLPIKIKFGETIPEQIAQGTTNLWYFIDQNGRFWEKLGSEELKADAAVVKRQPTANESLAEEIFLEGLVLKKATLPIQPIKRSEGVPNNSQITKGKYRLHLYAASAAGGSFEVNVAGSEQTFSVKGDQVLALNLALEKNAPLNLGFEVIAGEVVLCGLVLEPVE